ncbi:MAG: endonuclease/exonuclease/phosphatase family protein [Bacteroidota bacterium]
MGAEKNINTLLPSLGKFLLLLGFCSTLVVCSEEEVLISENDIINYDLKVSSFNIRFDNPGDDENRWDNRKQNIVLFLESENLDIIGMQEALVHQKKFLDDQLRDYKSVGIGREDGLTAGEFAPIYYKKELFTLLDSGTFWLSETPQSPSIGWDAVLERICTYAYLQDNRNDREIHFYNTHFDHVGSQARQNSAQLILDSIQANSADQWVVLAGDLNTQPGSGPYDVIVEGGLEDSYNSKVQFGPVGTFNGFNTEGSFDRRIDFVFMNGFSSESYFNNDLTVNGNFISDHFPVISVLEYRPK